MMNPSKSPLLYSNLSWLFSTKIFPWSLTQGKIGFWVTNEIRKGSCGISDQRGKSQCLCSTTNPEPSSIVRSPLQTLDQSGDSQWRPHSGCSGRLSWRSEPFRETTAEGFYSKAAQRGWGRWSCWSTRLLRTQQISGCETCFPGDRFLNLCVWDFCGEESSVWTPLPAPLSRYLSRFRWI